MGILKQKKPIVGYTKSTGSEQKKMIRMIGIWEYRSHLIIAFTCGIITMIGLYF